MNGTHLTQAVAMNLAGVRTAFASVVHALALALAIAAALLGPASPAVAQPGESLALDPLDSLRSIAAAYSRGGFAESVTVTVQGQGVSRGDSLVFARAGDGRVLVQAGALTLLGTASEVAAVHELDRMGIYRAGVKDGDALRAWRENLPPLPLPQLALALAKDITTAALTPYSGAVTWSSATLRHDAEAGQELVTLVGAGERAKVTLVARHDTWRLTSCTTEIDRGASVIRLAVEPAGGIDERAMDIGAERRVPLDAFAQLGPRPGDVTAGQPMPRLVLTRFRGAPVPAALDNGQPGVLVLFREWERSGVPTGLIESAREAAKLKPEVQLTVGVIIDFTSPLHNDRLVGLAGSMRDVELYTSASATRTIDRFTASSDHVLVAYDASGIVRLVYAPPRAASSGTPSPEAPDLDAKELGAKIVQAISAPAVP